MNESAQTTKEEDALWTAHCARFGWDPETIDRSAFTSAVGGTAAPRPEIGSTLRYALTDAFR